MSFSPSDPLIQDGSQSTGRLEVPVKADWDAWVRSALGTEGIALGSLTCGHITLEPYLQGLVGCPFHP